MVAATERQRTKQTSSFDKESCDGANHARDSLKILNSDSIDSEDFRVTAGRHAKKVAARLLENSQLFSSKTTHLTTVSKDDIVVGEKLGSGGFCVVHECMLDGRSLAVKKLKESVEKDPRQFKIASGDLVLEANFLSALCHPNIVNLHAVLEGPLEDSAGEFFIVMDKLQETLEDRIARWHRETNSSRNSRRTIAEKERKVELTERLKIALQIVQVLEYLHQKNVVYRDLKPENVGFDANGKLKIFDFGLAKELKDKRKGANGKYRLSGNTGSRSYMAPEVAKGWKYDCSVDIYSFGMLLWEICAKDLAFREMSQEAFMLKVLDGEERPGMEEWWPVELQWLIKKCWAFFPGNRPDAASIQEILKEIIEEQEEDEEDNHIRGIKSFRIGSRRSKQHSSGRHFEDRVVQSHRVEGTGTKDGQKKKGGFRLFGQKIF